MGARVMIIGRQAGELPAGLPESDSGAEYVLAGTLEEVAAELPACDVVFHYGRPRDALSANWARTQPAALAARGRRRCRLDALPGARRERRGPDQLPRRLRHQPARASPVTDAGPGQGPAEHARGARSPRVAAPPGRAAGGKARGHRGCGLDRAQHGPPPARAGDGRDAGRAHGTARHGVRPGPGHQRPAAPAAGGRLAGGAPAPDLGDARADRRASVRLLAAGRALRELRPRTDRGPGRAGGGPPDGGAGWGRPRRLRAGATAG